MVLKSVDYKLEKIYSDPRNPGGFRGVTALLKAANNAGIRVTREEVKRFLHQSDTYTAHYPSRTKFKTGQIQSTGLDSDHQADLAVLIDLKRYNKGYSYILVVVDVLSRFVMCAPVKNKTGKETATAYNGILYSSGRIPFRLYTDEGKEFLNTHFQKLLSEKEIIHKKPKNHNVKCALAENAVKRVKTRLYRVFSENNTYCWIDVLQDVVHGLNVSPIKSIGGIPPVDVNHGNMEKVWQKLYGEEKYKTPQHVFRVGDTVRLSKFNTLFKKGYKNTFTLEVFRIKKLLYRDPPVYIIEDLNGEEIDSIVYEPELVKYVPKQEFKIEKILRKRQKNRKTELLVKWLGYPSSFNSWIPSGDARRIR